MSAAIVEHDVTVLQGDVREQLATLPAGSVQCVVTSPPYYALRDYGCDGQIGLEETPGEYVAALVDVFREVRRVLANDGVFWLNLGDKWNDWPSNDRNRDFNERSGNSSGARKQEIVVEPVRRRKGRPAPGMHRKNLLGMPWRVAFALQDDGWILRAENIWAKRNFMPDPTKDRTARSHEHLFTFSKTGRYWYDADAIREESDPAQEAHNERYAKVYDVHTARAATTGQPGNVNNVGIHSRPGKPGRNARSVWTTISSQPFPGLHFAVMPPEMARRCIAAGCPPDGTVLDPFAGSGTTLKVARSLGRKSIGIELSSDLHPKIIRDRIGQTPLDFGGVA